MGLDNGDQLVPIDIGEIPDELKDLEITVGNQKIMADIIREGISIGFKHKAQKGGKE